MSLQSSSTTSVASTSACTLSDALSSSLHLPDLQSSSLAPNAVNSDVSLNNSFLSEHISSFPATPSAEDLFKNLTQHTVSGESNHDIESTYRTCNSKNNEVLPTHSTLICTNPTYSYSNIKSTLTGSPAGNSYFVDSNLQNVHSEKILGPSNSINIHTLKPSLLLKPSDFGDNGADSYKSLNFSPIEMKSTNDKSFFTIHVGRSTESFSELPMGTPSVNCSSALDESNSVDHQINNPGLIQQHFPIGNTFKAKDHGTMHKEITLSETADNSEYVDPDVDEGCEPGVLPPDLCLFEVVSMLKCGRCDDVFPDTASLILHYQKSHLLECEASPVQIKVDTAANATLQKNKPVVVCHKCGSKVPSSVLDWYVSKVRGKVPGRRRKIQPSIVSAKIIESATSGPSSPASDLHPRSEIVPTCSDDVTTDSQHWTSSPSRVCGSPESCNDTSRATCISSQEPMVTSHSAATESHCSDESSELSEEESVIEDDSKKDGTTGDTTTQVYVLDVLGATAEHKASEDAADGCVRRKRLVRPPSKFTDEEAPAVAVQPPPRIYKCGAAGCRLRFSSPESCDLHRRCHRPTADGGLPFICPFCSFTMKKWYSVQRHLWQVHKQDVDMLQCSVCSSYRAHNAHTLQVHLETHSAVMPYVCRTCGQGFRQLSQLLNHSKTHNKDHQEQQQQQPGVKCQECGKLCCNKRQLARHVKAVHEKTLLHRCSLCPYATNRPTDLRNHKRRHMKDKSFECCVCEMRFCDQTSQRRHLLRHLPLSLLQCPLCPFHTSRPQHFSSHFSTQHTDQQLQHRLSFECKLCGETCSTVRLYCAHSRTHHSDLLQQLIAQHPPTSKPS